MTFVDHRLFLVSIVLTFMSSVSGDDYSHGNYIMVAQNKLQTCRGIELPPSMRTVILATMDM